MIITVFCLCLCSRLSAEKLNELLNSDKNDPLNRYNYTGVNLREAAQKVERVHNCLDPLPPQHTHTGSGQDGDSPAGMQALPVGKIIEAKVLRKDNQEKV